jgi:ribosomal protein L2
MNIILNKNFYLKRVLHKLSIGFTANTGKNFYGRITVFHKSKNYSKQKRIIDYKRIFCSESTVFHLEKKPLNTSYICLLFYFFGIFSYIIASDNMQVGDIYKGFCWVYKKKENFSIFLCNFNRGA